MAEEALGPAAVERFLKDRLEDALAVWLEPFVDGKSKRGTKAASGAPASEGEQVTRMLRPHVKEPSLLIGAGTGAMAAVLGVTRAIESEPWRLAVARAAFPDMAIGADDFFDVAGSFRTIVVVDYLQGLQKKDGYARMREFFPAAQSRLELGGRLLLSDLTAYQDDCVSQLAALDFEIEEIVAVEGHDRMVVVAQKAD
ncbi:MAG: hypothetical protein HY303_01990 [Candidatus Wallbacteria bacterium]|nr:hypothetical protein [Candidatus Wallbacteria bacterium]